jgi:hypothetical protein
MTSVPKFRKDADPGIAEVDDARGSVAKVRNQ